MQKLAVLDFFHIKNILFILCAKIVINEGL